MKDYEILYLQVAKLLRQPNMSYVIKLKILS